MGGSFGGGTFYYEIVHFIIDHLGLPSPFSLLTSSIRRSCFRLVRGLVVGRIPMHTERSHCGQVRLGLGHVSGMAGGGGGVPVAILSPRFFIKWFDLYIAPRLRMDYASLIVADGESQEGQLNTLRSSARAYAVQRGWREKAVDDDRKHPTAASNSQLNVLHDGNVVPPNGAAPCPKIAIPKVATLGPQRVLARTASCPADMSPQGTVRFENRCHLEELSRGPTQSDRRALIQKALMRPGKEETHNDEDEDEEEDEWENDEDVDRKHPKKKPSVVGAAALKRPSAPMKRPADALHDELFTPVVEFLNTNPDFAFLFDRKYARTYVSKGAFTTTCVG